ncbi:MAG: L,D-transpeptidase [Sulfuriferula sp.]
MKIKISLSAQTLDLLDGTDRLVKRYQVSTAANGAGELFGSYQTPRGQHVVRVKIGTNLPLGAVFVGRRPTGEIWSPELAAQSPGRDWILTRILWLSGKEPGFNRLGNMDTMRRYIYIHGTPDDQPVGVPGSHGCIRMANADVADLFDRIPVRTPVWIQDDTEPLI